MNPLPAATIVIPSRDRPDALTRALTALAAQETERPYEVVVVDDGSEPPLDAAGLPGPASLRVVRTGGVGPAGARNAGIAATTAPVVLFTDDDTEPVPGWIEAACRWLDENPGAAGVEGAIESPPWDPLWAMSMVVERPGSYLTANIAYRRDALESAGGFDEGLRMHGEDLDLAFRVMRSAPLGFEPAMRVVHHPRDLTARQLMRRGRMTGNDAELLRRHPDRYGRAARIPAALFPFVSAFATWLAIARGEGRRLLNPARAGRLAAIFAGYLWNVARGLLGR